MVDRVWTENSSVKQILMNQDASGAYMTAPSSEAFRFCWFRDSSFMAYSMLLQGEFESCKAFLNWGDRAICAQSGFLLNLINKRENDLPIKATELLPSRYAPDGTPHSDEWPGTQIDGYGFWLWCLGEYSVRTGDLRGITGMEESIRLIVKYLSTFWNHPCYDCWEENPHGIHPSSLACAAGGLKKINNILGEKEINDTVDCIIERVSDASRLYGWIPKSEGVKEIDSSSLYMTVFFRHFEPDNEIMTATVNRIIDDLVCEGSGGVKRFRRDTFYGGGEWILCTALMSLYYYGLGKKDKGDRYLEWIENQFDEQGRLPEQNLDVVNDKSYISVWEEKWGKQPLPDLLAHAMYLIALDERKKYVSGC